MLVLGLGSVIWPEPVLIAAMFTVGLIATVFGLYEVTVAIAIRHRGSRWWLVLAHGLASLGFGLLTVGAPALPLQLALVVIAVWFFVYAAVAWSAAGIVWHARGLRRTLLAGGCFHAALGLLAILYPAATIFALLFFGAVYAAMFGAWQLAAGLWLRSRLRAHTVHSRQGVLVASH